MFQLKNQKGQPVGPPFYRWQDAFNHRVAINGVGLRINELDDVPHFAGRDDERAEARQMGVSALD